MRYLNVNVHGWDIKRGACEEYPITNEINTDLKFVTWGSSEVGEPSFMALITVLVAARQEEKSDVTYRIPIVECREGIGRVGTLGHHGDR